MLHTCTCTHIHTHAHTYTHRRTHTNSQGSPGQPEVCFLSFLSFLFLSLFPFQLSKAFTLCLACSLIRGKLWSLGALGVLIVGFIVGKCSLFSGAVYSDYTNTTAPIAFAVIMAGSDAHEWCSACKYLNCVKSPLWDCSYNDCYDAEVHNHTAAYHTITYTHIYFACVCVCVCVCVGACVCLYVCMFVCLYV